MSSPCSSPINDFSRVEQPLPGLPSTTSISPDFKTPSNSFRMVFSGPFPKNSFSRKGVMKSDATFFCRLIADPDPHTLRFLKTMPARRWTTLFSCASRITLYQLLALYHISPFGAICKAHMRVHLYTSKFADFGSSTSSSSVIPASVSVRSRF